VTIMVHIYTGSAIGIRVLRHTDYVRVGLAHDRLAEKAIGRVRALDDLRQRTGP
jgi:hypothetical protein